MLARMPPRTSTLRMITGQLKDADIAARPSGVDKVPDEQIVAMLRGMVKSRRESVEMYRQGNRPELAEKEEAEIAVIEGFLPQQMDEAAMRGGGRRRGGRGRRHQRQGDGQGHGRAAGEARGDAGHGQGRADGEGGARRLRAAPARGHPFPARGGGTVRSCQQPGMPRTISPPGLPLAPPSGASDLDRSGCRSHRLDAAAPGDASGQQFWSIGRFHRVELWSRLPPGPPTAPRRDVPRTSGRRREPEDDNAQD